MRRSGTLAIVAALSFAAFVGLLSPRVLAYTPHDPILIASNAEFTASNGVAAGAGTSTDPYIIEGWEISGAIPPGSAGIQVRDTTAYFVIRNVFVHSPSQSYNGIELDYVSNATVMNSTVSDNQVGIAVAFSSNIVVRDNNASGNLFDGISLGGSNVLVAGNLASSNGGGMAFGAVAQATIRDNTIEDNDFGVVIDRSNDVHIENTTVRRNRYGVQVFFSNRLRVTGIAVMDNGEGLTVRSSSSMTIEDSSFLRSSQGTGISLIDTAGTHVARVVASQNDWSGIDLSSSPYTFIENTTAGSNGIAGITASGSANLTLIDIMSVGNAVVGVSIGGSPNASLVRSSILANGAGVGGGDFSALNNDLQGNAGGFFGTNLTIIGNRIDATNGDGIVANGRIIVEGNVVRNGRVGMYIFPATLVRVVGNEVSSFQSTGVAVSLVSERTVVTDNVIHDNGFKGLYLFRASNATVLRNNVTRNADVGIFIDDSTGVRIGGNNVMFNALQAGDSRGAENEWDDGYPAGGNFWSDYVGTDERRGPAQDQPGSDGIGDTPYSIDADSEDRYPLMAYVGDSEIPTVAIESPSPGQVFSTALAHVVGTAADTGGSGVKRVEVRLNGGAWMLANGTVSWSIDVPLIEGLDVLEARAIDHAANPSSVARVEVSYEIPDTVAPSINHAPPSEVRVGEPIIIRANVTDVHGVLEVTLFYRAVGASAFVSVPMIRQTGDEYLATIPARSSVGQVEYYLVANDTSGNSARFPGSGFLVVSIIDIAPPRGSDSVLAVLVLGVSTALIAISLLLFLRRKERTPPSRPPSRQTGGPPENP